MTDDVYVAQKEFFFFNRAILLFDTSNQYYRFSV